MTYSKGDKVVRIGEVAENNQKNGMIQGKIYTVREVLSTRLRVEEILKNDGCGWYLDAFRLATAEEINPLKPESNESYSIF